MGREDEPHGGQEALQPLREGRGQMLTAILPSLTSFFLPASTSAAPGPWLVMACISQESVWSSLSVYILFSVDSEIYQQL